MGCLEGKVFVVTGAGRGIGRAVAKRFAAEGARLVLCDLGGDTDGTGADPAVVDGAVAEAREAGAEAVGDASDVTDPATPAALTRRARDVFGRLDGLVSCAGMRRDRSLRKVTDEDVTRVLDLHVRANFALAREVAAALVDQGDGGSLVLMTGPAAFFGSARQALASAAAAGVVGLVRSAAVELRRHGIRVNGVAPTARTRLTEDLPLFQGVSEASMGPAHVAPVAAYLASDAASDVSGEILGVAGGRVYTFRCRETTGALVEDRPFEPAELGAAIGEITRG